MSSKTAFSSKKDETESTSKDTSNASEVNNSYRLHASQCSSISSESDLSFSLSIERELDLFNSRIIDDELPAFEIRLISPLGRTPSPIDNTSADFDTPTRSPTREQNTLSPRKNNPDFVALHDINAQISPPNDGDEDLSRTSSLETIFEGVFLSTPPRQRRSLRQKSHCRNSLLEKVVINRMYAGKENSAPSALSRPISKHHITSEETIGMHEDC